LLSTFLRGFKENTSTTQLTEHSCKVLCCIWRVEKGLEVNNTLRVSGVILSCGVANISGDHIVSSVGRISNLMMVASCLVESH
jgi:hypothetical protein